jgi:hypothetical protein
VRKSDVCLPELVEFTLAPLPCEEEECGDPYLCDQHYRSGTDCGRCACEHRPTTRTQLVTWRSIRFSRSAGWG